MGMQHGTETAVGPGTGSSTETQTGPETSTASCTMQVISVQGDPCEPEGQEDLVPPPPGIFLILP